MEDVKNDVAQQDDPAQRHETRGHLALHARLVSIALTLRGAVRFHQHDGGDDVHHGDKEQPCAHHPQQTERQMPQLAAVFIDHMRPGEELQIPQQVQNHKAKEHEARYGDDGFFSDG